MSPTPSTTTGRDNGGEHVVSENLAPLGEALVARDDHRAAFIATRDELEDHVGLDAVQGKVADLVDDEHRRSQVSLQLSADRPVASAVRSRRMRSSRLVK
jgi:hypothetical protein